jgi:hypothetical protein
MEVLSLIMFEVQSLPLLCVCSGHNPLPADCGVSNMYVIPRYLNPAVNLDFWRSYRSQPKAAPRWTVYE